MLVPVNYFQIPLYHTSRRGLSEKHHRNRLEREQWIVWRGGSIGNYRRRLVWPNVYRKYIYLTKLLTSIYPEHVEYLFLLCAVHHGMPDLICYRNGKFKFVECKLGYESLSLRQKKCITKLKKLGFIVEIHRLVLPQTLTRRAVVDLEKNVKIVREKQKKIRHYW